MIHLHLTTHPRTGTITIHGERFDLATWHRAGEGQMHATTTDGERVTLATADDGDGIHGGLCIGNTLAARREVWDAVCAAYPDDNPLKPTPALLQWWLAKDDAEVVAKVRKAAKPRAARPKASALAKVARARAETMF